MRIIPVHQGTNMRPDHASYYMASGMPAAFIYCCSYRFYYSDRIAGSCVPLFFYKLELT